MFYLVIEAVVVLLLFVGGLTQIVLPVMNDTPCFPLFRRKKLRSEIRKTREEIHDEELRATLLQLEEELAREKEANERKQTEERSEADAKN